MRIRAVLGQIAVRDLGSALAWWDRGTAAGMEQTVALRDAFWGDKYGQFKDPYGVTWAIVGPQ